MVTMRQAQTGNRVYGGVSQTPNMGRVSGKGAAGYLQREIRKNPVARPVGSDGKSDRRSGVARRALGNIRGNLGNNIGRGKAPNKPIKGAPGKSSGLPNKPASAGPGPAPAPVVTAVPQVQVNPAGQLQLPYDQSLSLEALEAQKTANDELYNLQVEEQQTLAEITQGRRDADINLKNMNEYNLNANAASGTAYSSQYGKAVADTATQHATTLSDLQRRESDFTQSAATRRATIQSTLQMQLAAAAQAYQDRLNEDAGDLGFGTYDGEVHEHEAPAAAPNKPRRTPPKKPKPGPKKPPPKKGNK